MHQLTATFYIYKFLSVLPESIHGYVLEVPRNLFAYLSRNANDWHSEDSGSKIDVLLIPMIFSLYYVLLPDSGLDSSRQGSSGFTILIFYEKILVQ